jgi:hypothetical protein
MAGIDDDDPIIGEGGELVSDSFAHPAFDSVAHDGLSQSPGRSKAEADRLWGSVNPKAKCHEEAARKARPSIVGFPEFRAAKDPAWFRK